MPYVTSQITYQDSVVEDTTDKKVEELSSLLIRVIKKFMIQYANSEDYGKKDFEKWTNKVLGLTIDESRTLQNILDEYNERIKDLSLRLSDLEDHAYNE